MNTSKQQILNLGTEIYRLTAKLPAEEERTLTEMFIRATGDIAANIAMSDADLTDEPAQFLSTACGKIAVIETLLLLCVKLNYLAAVEIATASNLCAELDAQMRKSLSEKIL